MERVTGIGGVFFKCQDPNRIREWYHDHLGVETRNESEGAAVFEWREKSIPERIGQTHWAPFPNDTRYFDPSSAPFMLNFRVSDLKAMLAQLSRLGVKIVGDVEEHDYGLFGWALDPEGNKIELWEPPS